MNIVKGIGLGMCIYIGWSLIEAVDEGTRHKVGKTIVKRIRSITKQEPKPKIKRNVIGFKAD